MKNKAVKKGAAHDPLLDIQRAVNTYNLTAEKNGRPKLLLFDAPTYKAVIDDYRHFSRVFNSDLFTLALGRLGWRETRFRRLDETMLAVTKEYGDDFKEDYKDDPDMEYTREQFERELKQYAGRLYQPIADRYGQNY